MNATEHDRVKNDIRRVVLAVAGGAALFTALPARVAEAQYTPTIQGGGASLPAPTYRQQFNCVGLPLTSPPDPASDTYVPSECTGASYPIDSTEIFRYGSSGSGGG
jgi:hypothetical protein